MTKTGVKKIAEKLSEEIHKSGKSKRIKVRTLLKHFGFEKRTEDNSSKITEFFSENDILLNPSIMKIGELWNLKLDDSVFLTPRLETARVELKSDTDIKIYDWKSDVWFDEVLTKVFRNEKEVENKFIIPLLYRLNFNENDRYDGMTINAHHGSKQTKLEVDFALFDTENENLNDQPLLIVEAKKENHLHKKIELEKAQKQAKSYAIWLGCRFGLVTDSKIIQVIDLFSSISGIKVIFECNREELKERFLEIYNLISKGNLTKFYEKQYGE